MTNKVYEPWRTVAPVQRSEATRFNASRVALAEYLSTSFREAFRAEVDEVLFDAFPDGLAATLFVHGTGVDTYNVWAVGVSSALGDAGVDVHVVVRSSDDRLDR